MTIVRCSGCTRQIGISPSVTPLRNKVWCNEWCMSEPIVGQYETRDAIITELARTGLSASQIAAMFGVGRSRVQQIASAGRS